MSGAWSKLKKTLRPKSSGKSASFPQFPPPVPDQSDFRSPAPRSPSPTNSSSSSIFSGSLRSVSHSSKKACAICLRNLKSGLGQAIFTAECSHSFHFSCIANNVEHGNYFCPTCRFKWKDIPCRLPSANTDAKHKAAGRAQGSPYQGPVEDLLTDHTPAPAPQQPTPVGLEPSRYSDDEPLVVVYTDSVMPASCAPSNNLSVKAFTEFPAVAASESVSDFAVLVSMHAPTLSEDDRQVKRAPIDLVTVLDVSGSMDGLKLFLLKRAVYFIIENLGPDDRLSIVSFSESARRIFPLRKMTDRGRKDARLALSYLYPNGRTDIVSGLKKGARVLEERRERNPVASIILLSDGKDNCYQLPSDRCHQDRTSADRTHVLEYLSLLPVSICTNNRELRDDNPQPTFPVHAFGFGADHDASIMHAISDASGGTFSFIESVGILQDAFARCIAGLLSVVAREVQLTVTSISPGVEIGSIASGKYPSEISDQGHQGVINIGDLYADEEKEFLVRLSVPLCPTVEGEEEMKRTSLLNIACSYCDAASNSMVQLEGETVAIRRPEVLSAADTTLSLEVDRQRNRLMMVESIAEAKEMAESGNLQGARALLRNRKSTLLSSASAQSGDDLCSWLEAELLEIRGRMKNMRTYETSGRAYVLSGLSSHSWQRATTRGDSANHTPVLSEGRSPSYSGPIGYDTPSMFTMVMKSQDLSALYPREQVS